MNPRKLAKCGFINTDVNRIKCADPQCYVSVKLKEHLNFCNDEKTARQWFKKIRQAHLPTCRFKVGQQEMFPRPEYYQKGLDSNKFVIMSRKLFYLRW